MSLESMRDADLDSSNSSYSGPTEDDPLLYGRPRGLMTEEQMIEIVLRYGLLRRFVCKLPNDTEYIYCPSPI